MSSRTLRVLAGLVLSFACSLAPSNARAGWGVDPVELVGSSSEFPAVALAPDSHGGAIVVWQEQAPVGASLRATHLLPTGDVDPLWPAGSVILSPRDISRPAIGAVSDAAGGAFVWWLEGAQIYLSHIDAQGLVAPGWTATGRMLGGLWYPGQRPLVKPDGTGGVYVEWVARSVDPIQSFGVVRIAHFQSAGGSVQGWPAAGRVLGAVGLTSPTVVSAGMDVAPDGSLWVAWCTAERDTGFMALPGEVRLTHLAASGSPVTGWALAGEILAAFDATVLNQTREGFQPTRQHLVAVACRTPGQGAFVVAPTASLDNGYAQVPLIECFEVDAQGHAVAPARSLGDIEMEPSYQVQASIRAESDGRGGVFFVLPGIATDTPPFVSIFGMTRTGASMTSYPAWASRGGLEVVASGDGRLLCANGDGSTVSWGAPAGVGCFEYPNGPHFADSGYGYDRYGDVGIAPTGEGGAIFVWSQYVERHGLYAVRLGPAGQVTGVPPVAIGPSLRAHFARGRGVLAQVTLPGALEADLALLDVQGRVESTLRAASNSTLEATFPGTAQLSPGVYFVRASGAGEQLTRRVVVLR